MFRNLELRADRAIGITDLEGEPLPGGGLGRGRMATGISQLHGGIFTDSGLSGLSQCPGGGGDFGEALLQFRPISLQ